MRGVPQRLEQRVGEAQRHQVLHRLLAEIMVDPVDPVLGEVPADRVVDRAGRGQAFADRLFDHHARAVLRQAGGAEPVADRPEQLRRCGEVEHPDPAGPLAQASGQGGPAGLVAGIGRRRSRGGARKRSSVSASTSASPPHTALRASARNASSRQRGGGRRRGCGPRRESARRRRGDTGRAAACGWRGRRWRRTRRDRTGPPQSHARSYASPCAGGGPALCGQAARPVGLTGGGI